MNPNSVFLASGGACSGIRRRRLRRALLGLLQWAPLTGWGFFGSLRSPDLSRPVTRRELQPTHTPIIYTMVPGIYTCLIHTWYIFSPSHLLSSPFYSLSPSRNSDAGSHSRLFSPLPTTVRALHLFRENISALLSSTRAELCLPTLGALSS